VFSSFLLFVIFFIFVKKKAFSPHLKMSGGVGDDDDGDDTLGAFAPFLTQILAWDYYKIYAESMSAYQQSNTAKKTVTKTPSSSLKPIPLRFSNA
jgi:hypothetical protein